MFKHINEMTTRRLETKQEGGGGNQYSRKDIRRREGRRRGKKGETKGADDSRGPIK
jgi:hypothetical protein